jgi:hypothetical protein
VDWTGSKILDAVAWRQGESTTNVATGNYHLIGELARQDAAVLSGYWSSLREPWSRYYEGPAMRLGRERRVHTWGPLAVGDGTGRRHEAWKGHRDAMMHQPWLPVLHRCRPSSGWTRGATVLLVTVDPAEELAPHARVAPVLALCEQWGRRWAVDAVVCGEGSGGSVAAVAAVTESGGSQRVLEPERGSCGIHFSPFQRPLATGGFLQIFEAAYYRACLCWRPKIEPGLLKQYQACLGASAGVAQDETGPGVAQCHAEAGAIAFRRNQRRHHLS